MEEAGGRQKLCPSQQGCIINWREREIVNTFLPRVFKVKIAALSCFTIKEIRALGERDKGQMNGFPLSTCNIYQSLKNTGHNSWTVPQNKINNEECWAHLRGCLEQESWAWIRCRQGVPLFLLTEGIWLYLNSYGRKKEKNPKRLAHFFNTTP